MVPVCGGAGGRLLRMVGAGRRPLLLSVSRGRGSCQAGGSPSAHGRALAVKKRGYDITRNPHLNKVGAAGGLSSRGVGGLGGRRGSGLGGGWRGGGRWGKAPEAGRRCPAW